MNEPEVKLPEPAGWLAGSALRWIADPARTPGAYSCVELRKNSLEGQDSDAIYTADQMQAYARAAALLERERCAQVCESKRPPPPPTGDYGTYTALTACTAAIRAKD